MSKSCRFSKMYPVLLVLSLTLVSLIATEAQALELSTHEGDFTFKSQFSMDVVDENQHYHLRSRVEKGAAYLANTVDIKISDGDMTSYSDKFIVGYKLSQSLVFRLVNSWQPDEDNKNQTREMHTAELTYLFR